MYNFLLETIKDAGSALRSAYGHQFQAGYKGDDPRDEVTQIDLEINKQIGNAIKNHFPEHGIHSEESDDVRGSEYLWAIDPIDGTSNFARGIPHFATCIGLIKHDEVIMGGVYNPVADELFHFQKGEGAYLNDEEISVSDIEQIEDAYILLHGGRGAENQRWMRQTRKDLYGRANKIRDFAGSALDVCNVAAGKAEATLYGRMTPIDIVSALGIAQEAGAEIYINKEKGKDLLRKDSTHVYVVNNEEIYRRLFP